MSQKIVFLDASTVDYGDMDLSIFSKYGDFISHDCTEPNDLFDRIKDATIIITNKVIIDKDIIDKLLSLKLIAVAATGYNNVDIKAAAKQGISVVNAAGYSTNSVAQLTITFILALSSNLIKYNMASRDGSWSQSKIFTIGTWPTFDLVDKTIAILGMGAIGTKVSELCKSLGMNVAALHREGVEYGASGIKRYKLDELLEIADFVTIHMPLTDYSNGLVNREFFQKMKRNAFLINMARGAVVDSSALADALNNGKISGAAVDVMETEPPLMNEPLLEAKNLIITPHIAWASIESRKKLINEISENINSHLQGIKRNNVN